MKIHLIYHKSVGTPLKKKVKYFEPQLCEYCDKAFANIRDLKIHMISHNLEESESEEDQEVFCDKCTKIFSSVKNLKLHMKDDHENDLSTTEHVIERPQPKKQALLCDKCFECFESTESLAAHIKECNPNETVQSSKWKPVDQEVNTEKSVPLVKIGGPPSKKEKEKSMNITITLKGIKISNAHLFFLHSLPHCLHPPTFELETIILTKFQFILASL